MENSITEHDIYLIATVFVVYLGVQFIAVISMLQSILKEIKKINEKSKKDGPAVL